MLVPSTEPTACEHADGVQHGWLSAALSLPAIAMSAAETREALPAVVMRQLRYKALQRGTQPARGKQQHQQKAPSVPLPCAAINGDELDIGACMAALDDQAPMQSPPADSPARRNSKAAAEDRLPAAVIAHEQAAPAPSNKVSGGPAAAPQTTGVFAKREKRKAEADSKRSAKRAVGPDGAGDLSFFMQLRKPGTGGGTAPTLQPVPAESGTVDSTDSSAGSALGDDSDARNQPQVRRRRNWHPIVAHPCAGMTTLARRHCSTANVTQWFDGPLWTTAAPVWQYASG